MIPKNPQTIARVRETECGRSSAHELRGGGDARRVWSGGDARRVWWRLHGGLTTTERHRTALFFASTTVVIKVIMSRSKPRTIQLCLDPLCLISRPLSYRLVQTQCWCTQGRWLPSPGGVRD